MASNRIWNNVVMHRVVVAMSLAAALLLSGCSNGSSELDMSTEAIADRVGSAASDAATTSMGGALSPPRDVYPSDPWVAGDKFAVRVSWKKPVSPGSAPISGYEILWGEGDDVDQYDRRPAGSGSMSRSQIALDLEPGRTYRFMVAVWNEDGQWAYSKRTIRQMPSSLPAETTTATSASCSLEEEGRDLVREWNRVSGELLAVYTDASATGDQYIETSERLLPILNRVVQDLRSLRGCIPAEERIFFEPFLGTYNDKFSGYSALETGVRIGSPAAQEDAIAILMEANRRSVAMVCEIARASGQELPGADVC